MGYLREYVGAIKLALRAYVKVLSLTHMRVRILIQVIILLVVYEIQLQF